MSGKFADDYFRFLQRLVAEISAAQDASELGWLALRAADMIFAARRPTLEADTGLIADLLVERREFLVQQMEDCRHG